MNGGRERTAKSLPRMHVWARTRLKQSEATSPAALDARVKRTFAKDDFLVNTICLQQYKVLATTPQLEQQYHF